MNSLIENKFEDSEDISTRIDKPFVVIWMVTYNQEKFIHNAIEGVLNQKTNFSFKLFIGEDCSTDGTNEICLSYQRKYSNMIQVIRTEKNGMDQNSKNTFTKCLQSSAKYIAMCEGDDYWTDPYKLQKQVDFLELNPEYSICWTKATYHDALNNDQYVPESFDQPLNGKSHYTIDLNSYYHKYATPTPTVVFVASKLARYDLKKFSYFNDSVLFFILLSQGKGALLNFNSAVYRIHNNGVWSGINNYNKKLNIFYALDSAITKIPQLSSFEHLVSWRKWNLTQAYYLLVESFSIKHFKQLTFLLIKIFKYQDRIEKRKALKAYLKALYSAK